jgi:hypothetical protein
MSTEGAAHFSLTPDSDIEKIALRVANTKGPRSSQMNFSGPFKPGKVCA